MRFAGEVSIRFSKVPPSAYCCYYRAMLKIRIKRQALLAERAGTRLVSIQVSVTALGDEDLLDLADIFAGDDQSPLWEMASAEMANRNLKL